MVVAVTALLAIYCAAIALISWEQNLLAWQSFFDQDEHLALYTHISVSFAPVVLFATMAYLSLRHGMTYFLFPLWVLGYLLFKSYLTITLLAVLFWWKYELHKQGDSS